MKLFTLDCCKSANNVSEGISVIQYPHKQVKALSGKEIFYVDGSVNVVDGRAKSAKPARMVHTEQLSLITDAASNDLRALVRLFVPRGAKLTSATFSWVSCPERGERSSRKLVCSQCGTEYEYYSYTEGGCTYPIYIHPGKRVSGYHHVQKGEVRRWKDLSTLFSSPGSFWHPQELVFLVEEGSGFRVACTSFFGRITERVFLWDGQKWQSGTVDEMCPLKHNDYKSL